MFIADNILTDILLVSCNLLGCSPGVWCLIADVSEHCFCFIFLDQDMKNFRYSFVTIQVETIVKFKLCKAGGIALWWGMLMDK
jgi:hypothetical protein